MRRLNQATRTFPLIGTIRLILVAVISLVNAHWVAAQEPEQAGIEQGNYNIKQSIEFGFRFVNTNGSEDTYNTFVNLQQGPRLLDFSTEMRSIELTAIARTFPPARKGWAAAYASNDTWTSPAARSVSDLAAPW